MLMLMLMVMVMVIVMVMRLRFRALPTGCLARGDPSPYLHAPADPRRC